MSTPLGNGDDVQLMAEYEFKKPITATIIFCENDDEILSSETTPNNYSTNNTNNRIEGYEATSKSKDDLRAISTEKNTKQLKVENETKGILNTIKQGFQFQAEVIASRENPSTNTNNITTTTLQGCIERHPLGSITPSQEDNITSNKVNECLQTLLNVVSNHMVFIMKAYAEYRTYTKTTSDRMVLESEKKSLQLTKYKFFYMSYSTVANILLPKENDKAFMQNFIENTVKIAESNHLYFRHSDMSLLCKEMFGWVKSYNQHPFLAGLLNKESERSAITTNSWQEQLDSDKANNALDNSYCIFKSGPTDRELSITVTSADVQNVLNVQNVPLGQSTQQVSDELRTNANVMNYQTHYHVHNVAPRQRAPPPEYSSHYPVPNVTYRQVAQPANNELRTNGISSNYFSHYPVLNAPSTQRVLPAIDEWRTNANVNNYTSQGPALNMTLSKEPQPTSRELRFNAYSTNYTSHQQTVQTAPSGQTVQPHMDELRTNLNNYVYHDTAQYSPSRHTVLTPSKAKQNKDRQSKNYMNEFEKFYTSNRNRPTSLNKSKSTRHQSNNLRVQQQEAHHHPTYMPPTSRPRQSPYYSPHIGHHDAVTTPQNYVQNQIGNSTHCDDFQSGQKSVDVNRSLSRDSGYMSPLTCAPQDPMNNSPRYDQVDSTSALVTPMITYVTSLNPSVAYIKDGVCHVCGKLTKVKCLGCFKCYYCSNQCQIDDWKNHVSICKI